jgi:hypothetical protein
MRHDPEPLTFIAYLLNLRLNIIVPRGSKLLCPQQSTVRILARHDSSYIHTPCYAASMTDELYKSLFREYTIS